jgi:hypothetical protein
MRIPFAAATLALLFAAAPAAAQQEARGVVFAVTRIIGGNEVVLEPVALLTPDGFAPPVREYSDSATEAFNARWLATGRTYPVLAGGVPTGTVTVQTTQAPNACPGMNIRGTFEERPASGAWGGGLAGEGLPRQASAPWLRAATAAERRELDRLATALLEAHGTDMADRNESDTAAAALLVSANARPILVGSYTLRTYEPLYRHTALLIIAEQGPNGYRPAYTWVHEGVLKDTQSRRLVGAADLDGDWAPELVLRNHVFENWEFGILKHTEHGWIQVYRGGRGGC